MNFFGKSNDETYEKMKTGNDKSENAVSKHIKEKAKQTIMEKIDAKAQELVDRTANYRNGFILLFIGSVFIILSLFFLPLIVASPQTFCVLNTFGTCTLFVSLIFIKGKDVLKVLFGKEKILFSVIFILSALIELYFAILGKSTIVILICLTVHLTSITYLLASILPGGIKFVTKAFKFVFLAIKGLCVKSSGGSGNILPF